MRPAARHLPFLFVLLGALLLRLPALSWLPSPAGDEGNWARYGLALSRGEPAASARELIAAYRQMLARAHDHGMLVYGATLLPFEGFGAYYGPEAEADRQALNGWIRSGELDGVIDFDAAARDPGAPTRLAPAVDGGDHLHPSAAGYRIMADSVDLALFR